MHTIDTTAISEPERWNIVFSTVVSKWWIRYLAAGKFKHVWAFAYLSNATCWLIYDVHLTGTRIAVVPDSETNRAWLGVQLTGCEVVSMRRQTLSGHTLFGFWCVTAIKHLLGVRCRALRPDALWHYCLRNGGDVIRGSHAATIDAATSGDGPAGAT